jgi:predicted amidophosphoribosyltransferase
LDEVQRVVPIELVAAATCRACLTELSGSYVFCPHCGEKVPEDHKGSEVHEEKREGVMSR